MADPRDDVPLEDLQEQLRGIDVEPEADEVPPADSGSIAGLDPLAAVEANEADVAEQSLPVAEDADEDYPREDSEE
ncbi:MAG TPA: hypothetical protein VFJ94_09920 [Intrasporangium sp.]|uniref:hypothetical protein n=1 Tax=Intrasporangium sp. TaxID=1925024 RepID=UPI002D77C881|nr:hypothetical protein [Intrasporangium sp.]HET7398824.1 hypothetical protein [Intrasporangium sp.]